MTTTMSGPLLKPAFRFNGQWEKEALVQSDAMTLATNTLEVLHRNLPPFLSPRVTCSCVWLSTSDHTTYKCPAVQFDLQIKTGEHPWEIINPSTNHIMPIDTGEHGTEEMAKILVDRIYQSVDSYRGRLMLEYTKIIGWEEKIITHLNSDPQLSDCPRCGRAKLVPAYSGHLPLSQNTADVTCRLCHYRPRA